MRDPAAIPPADWAAALVAVDPALGGIALRARAGPGREAWIAAALALSGRAARRVPSAAADDRLFGGLDLAATLAAGRPVIAPGLVTEIGCGTLILPMAERLATARAVRLAQAWDAGAPFSVLALDEADEDSDGPPAALLDRLAFHVTLPQVPQMRAALPCADFTADEVAAARDRLAAVQDAGDAIAVLTGTAAALGIRSLRAPRLALRAARAAAALLGEDRTTDTALQLAAALVLAPRATQLPDAPQNEPPQPEPQQPEPGEGEDDRPQDGETKPPEELVLEAARAAIPPDLLARLAAGGALARRAGAQGAGAGDEQKGTARGRPAGTRRGDPRSGARLDLVATLRSAAPWQPLRRKAMATADGRVIVTADDFRVRQYRQRKEKVVIFLVDASGSAALTRLAETKGAIELMLAQAYVRREQVALIAFRGTGAEMLLPPTRSLVQAKRRLAGLPGGGGTPLAAGLEAALDLATRIARRGQSAHLAILTDGRANIARDGTPGRDTAAADATTTARLIRAAGIPALLIDTAPRPQPSARALSAELGARYLPMPRADARTLSGVMQAALDQAPGGA